MKKIVLLIALAATSIGFTSCNKTYTCSCLLQTIDTSTGDVMQSGQTESPIEARSESDAKTQCESGNSSLTSFGIQQSITCTLKP